MTEALNIAIVGIAALAAIALAGQLFLRAFRDWIAYKRYELAERVDGELEPAGGLIELADLRERVRKLEAIAAGIDP